MEGLEGLLSFANGNTYNGQILDGKPHGKGCLLYKNGCQFVGEFKQGVPFNGLGYIQYDIQNDDVTKYMRSEYIGWEFMRLEYTGSIFEGQRNGYGTLQYPDGWSFKGFWADDLPYTGEGFYIYANGDHFEGSINDGLCTDGRTSVTLSNGSKYIGKILNGKFNGNGTMVYPNGDKLECFWKDDQPYGKCILKYPDGTVCNVEYYPSKHKSTASSSVVTNV